MLDPSAYDRIDRYLDQEMSAEEGSAFVAELRQNEELAAAFELRRQIYLSAWLAGKEEEKQRLDALGREFMAAGPPDELPEDPTLEPETHGAKPKPLWQRSSFQLAMAAAVALLILVVWRLQPQSPEQLGQELYAAYYDPKSATLPDDLRTTAERGDAPQTLTDSLLLAGQTAQQEKNYPRLALIYGQLTELYPNDEEYPYYQAVAYLKAEAYQEAARAFARIDARSGKYNQARWHRGLVLLRLGRLEEAKGVFQELAELKYYGKRDEAAAILEQLNLAR